MKKSIYFQLILCALMSFFPELALADFSSPINFSPPPSDVSVTFLTNIFGIVDGVLYGGGSQIMGSMFAVFNAAVLSIGGMILVYTIVIATINTAGEGKLMGKSMSNIWVPIRTTMGIGLLFTYPSGYSVLQVFVMWVVVQGIGAADLVWNAALDYLQRGGVIVAPMLSSADSNNAGTDNAVINAAGVIITGTTCMVALQQQLNTLQENYLAVKDTVGTPCYGLKVANPNNTTEQEQMAQFCNYTIPDFLSSVDIIGLNMAKRSECMPNGVWSSACTLPSTSSSIGAVVSAPMPNFNSTNAPAVYAGLNGICGTIKWDLMNEKTIEQSSSQLSLSAEESTDMSMSRATAVNQMYADLSLVANTIVRNDLTLYGQASTCDGASSSLCYFSTNAYTAVSPLGVPAPSSGYSTADRPCDPSETCTSWVSPNSSFSALLNGTEYQGSVRDYNAIMSSTLNALGNADTIAENSGFISHAQEQGWIMAGSYFFNLAQLNEASQSSETDTESGLGNSLYGADFSKETFCENQFGSSTKTSALCTWYTGAKSSNASDKEMYNSQIAYLIQGPVVDGSTATAKKPDYSASQWPSFYVQELNATVYGYAGNGSNVTVADQQGFKAPSSFITKSPVLDLSLKKKSKERCKGWTTEAFCEVFINKLIIKGMINPIIELIYSVVVGAMTTLIFLPMAAFSLMFVKAASLMSSSVNSIVSLAHMGDLFINTAINLIIVMTLSVIVYCATILGAIPVFSVLAMAGPLLLSWMGMILAMGVSLAYYIPMVPYLLYTFAGIGWMISVLEAMVAAPLVALGVSLPEGDHDVFGKGIHALMLILNAFLRPTLIVVGYIGAIIISTVGVWLINTGFSHFQTAYLNTVFQTNWTILFVNLFLFFMYVTMCIGVVNTAYDLIHQLPEHILRWIGGQNATGGLGSQAANAISGQIGESNKQGAQAVQSGALAKGPKKEGGEKNKKDHSENEGSASNDGGDATPPDPTTIKI